MLEEAAVITVLVSVYPDTELVVAYAVIVCPIESDDTHWGPMPALRIDPLKSYWLRGLSAVLPAREVSASFLKRRPTHEGQQATCVVSGLNTLVVAVVNPFGHMNGPRAKTVGGIP